MESPVLKVISQKEFDEGENLYKLIDNDYRDTYVTFSLNDKKYYIAYQSFGEIKIDLEIFEKENYLLIGVDRKVVILNLIKGNILFSMGLFGAFNRFENTSDLLFTIFTETENIVINKNSLSICQIIDHELEL